MLRRSSVLLALLLVGCSLHPNVSPLVEPTAIATETNTPTLTEAPTVTLSPTPTETATPTPDWSATPTQIGTATPAIIEVTPLGGGEWWVTPAPKLEHMTGTYTPHAVQNVRYGPGIGYAVRYRLAAGNTVRVHAWVSSLPVEAWLCLDEGDLCTEALALVYDGKELGVLEYGE